ncbi:MAG: 3-dehydroquinate synthase family protein, partial [Armatimonadota bacterium]|nr:3-dehydroquinate synthase family protein [Armatimonadota bacterium]
YLRGVAFVQIPTSLLAQVDASVGGKTAVNHRAGKNLIGTFYQPRLVVADPVVLRTLPKRELRSGLAEIVKHGMVLSAPYFHRMEELMPALLRRDVEALTEAVAGSCQLKAAVVAADERESGERALLNYGHTFGHALEAVTAFRRFRHGEAVSLGMEMAASLACDLGLLAPEAAAAQRRLLQAAGLPVALRGRPPCNTAQLLDAMRYDKKVARGRLRFVLARGIGRGEVRADVPEATVSAVCDRFLSGS